MDDMTFNEHVAAAIALADTARGQSIARSRADDASDETLAQHNAAARDLSLTITHLEDANTRYNSGRYHQKGSWMRADPDKTS